jgi:hypothetical protein
MDSIKQWAFSVSGAMVAAGLCRRLIPRGGMEKLFRATVSVFFLCCLLSPFALERPAVDFQAQAYPQEAIEERARRLEEAVASQTEEAARWEAARLVGEKLDELGINYRDVAIKIEQNEITAEVILDRSHERDHVAIQAALEDALGFRVRLGYQSSP